MMGIKESKSMEEYIKEMPFLLKVALCMYIIPAGLNSLYNLGYMLGEYLRTIF